MIHYINRAKNYFVRHLFHGHSGTRSKKGTQGETGTIFGFVGRRGRGRGRGRGNRTSGINQDDSEDQIAEHV